MLRAFETQIIAYMADGIIGDAQGFRYSFESFFQNVFTRRGFINFFELAFEGRKAMVG